MVRSLLGVSAAMAMAAMPTVARAETCYDLRSQLNGNTGDLFGIAADYPKTHIAIVTCFIGSESSDEATACAAAMVLGACFGMGGDECSDLTSRWGRAASNYQYIANRMRDLGCRR